MTQPTGDEESTEQHKLIYRAQMSRLYHRKRERFFALLDRYSKAFSLIAGTAVFSSLLTTLEAKSFAGLAVAICTLPSLVFAWSDKSRLHSELAAEYVNIEADIASKGILEWGSIDIFKSRLIAIAAKEPPELSALIRQCQNELAIAAEQTDKVFSLTLLERMFIHLFDMPKNRAK